MCALAIMRKRINVNAYDEDSTFKEQEHPRNDKGEFVKKGEGGGFAANSRSNFYADIPIGEKRGKGYIGQSMSVNAHNAYLEGEKPISKWSKKEIIETAEYELDDDKFKELGLDRLTKGELQDLILQKTGWHHTGAHYNKTDFYGLNIDKLKQITKGDIDRIISNRKKPTLKSDEEKAKEKQKQDIRAEARGVARKLAYIYKSGALNLKKITGVYERWRSGKMDIDEVYEKAISNLIKEYEIKVDKWRKLPPDHWRQDSVKAFEADPRGYVEGIYYDDDLEISANSNLFKQIEAEVERRRMNS